MMVRPPKSRMAPYSHGHMGLALNSLNSSCMYEPRTATVVGTIVRNGPNTRANMRVRRRDCSDVVIAASLVPTTSRPTSGRYARPSVGRSEAVFDDDACPSGDAATADLPQRVGHLDNRDGAREKSQVRRGEFGLELPPDLPSLVDRQ